MRNRRSGPGSANWPGQDTCLPPGSWSFPVAALFCAAEAGGSRTGGGRVNVAAGEFPSAQACRELSHAVAAVFEAAQQLPRW